MPRVLFTSQGAKVELGRELGKGGEGSVFELPALPAQVAKLYHAAPGLKKQAKLSFMASAADEKLLEYASWPQATLHTGSGGPVVGFLMPKVVAREPIHMLYSPAHRKQERPKVAWDFLLYSARNTAAAFEILHSHGHVLGDVNQGNVLVGADSKVVLIDCDSFQVDANGTLHLCEVGVGHFTPPELQGLPSFDGVRRTPNHDNFGLALIIFHLLFGGRHPYSGVPLAAGVGDQLEHDIQGLRYAYARDAKLRSTSPPPRSIPLAILPQLQESMFHAAFTERGAQGGRPTAQQWVQALDGLRGALKRCNQSPVHMYPNLAGACPWCALEQQGVVYFVDLGTSVRQATTSFILAKAWALVEAVHPPPPLPIPSLRTSGLTARPLPAGITGRPAIIAGQLLVVFLAIVWCALVPSTWFLALLVGGLAVAAVGEVNAKERSAERTRRQTAEDTAKQVFDRAVERVRKEAGPEEFVSKRSEYARMRDEYAGLAEAEKRELDRLQTTALERQKQKFLDSHFIDTATIPGVGPGRKAALRSFGIETAGDIDYKKVRMVRGFGEGLTRAVVDWRNACERRFSFNPRMAVTDADRNIVLSRCSVRRAAIETLLNAAPLELQRFKQSAAAKRASLETLIEEAAERLAQATVDRDLL